MSSFSKIFETLWTIDYFDTNSIFIEEKFEFRESLTAEKQHMN